MTFVWNQFLGFVGGSLDTVVSWIFNFLPDYTKLETWFHIDVSKMDSGFANIVAVAQQFNLFFPFDTLFFLLIMVLIAEFMLMMLQIVMNAIKLIRG